MITWTCFIRMWMDCMLWILQWKTNIIIWWGRYCMRWSILLRSTNIQVWMIILILTNISIVQWRDRACYFMLVGFIRTWVLFRGLFLSIAIRSFICLTTESKGWTFLISVPSITIWRHCKLLKISIRWTKLEGKRNF